MQVKVKVNRKRYINNEPVLPPLILDAILLDKANVCKVRKCL